MLELIITVFVALVLVGVDLSFPVITFVIFPFVVIVVASGVNDCDSAVNGGAIALVLLVVRPMRFTVGVDLVAAGLLWWCCDVRVLSKLMNKLDFCEWMEITTIIKNLT